MFYELRQYRTQPNQRDRFASMMETTIIPFMAFRGMVITDTFLDEQDENRYVWMRRFEDEAHRVRSYAAVYESLEWQNEIAPAANRLLIRDQAVVTRLVPVSSSTLG